MPRRLKPLGKGELEVLRLVRENHPVTVREVAQRVAESGGQARTTTLTVMERLRSKGYLRRRKVDGVNQYTALHGLAVVMAHRYRMFRNRCHIMLRRGSSIAASHQGVRNIV